MLRGTLIDGGIAVFKGIPYAQPPVGDLRWREPIPERPWTGVRDATTFGALCPQRPSIQVPNALESSREDCLFLNVWTAEWPSSNRRPVLIAFPGGGNTTGGTSDARVNGEHLSRRGIVVVTAHYRLGSFGFFSHPALTRESPHGASGNQGLLDQVAVLDWVRANIDQFGGNPDEVTLMGVSVPAMNIHALMTSPLAAGKFRRAITQSLPFGLLGDPLSRAQAEKRGAEHTRSWGARDAATLGELRAIPMERILEAQPTRPVAHLNLSVDGYVVPLRPALVFAAGRQHEVPIIVGNTARDFTPGAAPPTDLDALMASAYGQLANRARPLYVGDDPLYGRPEVQWATDTTYRCPAILQLVQHVAAGQRGFAYEFARLATPEIQPGGNIHGFDGGFVFGTYASRTQGTTLKPVAFGPADAALSALMQRYWTNFVKTGDPNGPGLPAWPAFSEPARAYVQFSTDAPVVKEGLRRAQCDLFAENQRRLSRTQ
jgi:para-nitrobenzyl esterase